MKIALNLHFLRPEITGGGETYAVELVRALSAIDGSNEYLVLCNRARTRLDLPNKENFRIESSRVSASLRPLRYAWEQMVLPTKLRNRGLDLVHSMGYVSPILSDLKQVVTIPDANWRELDTMPPIKRLALAFFVRRSAAAAEVVLTGTQAAAAALMKHLPAKRGRIAVVPLGADHLPPPASAGSPVVDSPYLIALSGAPRHKNIPRLLEAFARISSDVPHDLVIAGNVPDTLRATIKNETLGRRVRWTGYVSDQQLASLFAAADLFVFPSWHEGFGLPLLEAQRFGTPVAAAAIPALIEIADGTAALFDPFSIESMASAIMGVIKAPERRKALKEAARRNAARYTWEATARATLEIYEEVAATVRGPSRPR